MSRRKKSYKLYSPRYGQIPNPLTIRPRYGFIPAIFAFLGAMFCVLGILISEEVFINNSYEEIVMGVYNIFIIPYYIAVIFILHGIWRPK